MIFKVAPIFILFTFACGLAINHKYSNENESQNYYSGPAKQYQPSHSESYNGEREVEKYEDSYPKYEFKYAVNDEHSGDTKSQHEVRDGDKVRGVYTLEDTDGFQRIVEYTADDKEGFVAVVRREPIAGFKPAHHSQQQQYESYTAQQQPAQPSRPNYKQQYETYTVKPQPEQQRQEYKPVPTQKYVAPSSQIGVSSGYDKSQNGKYFIKYSTSAPEIITAAPEHRYQYVAPVSDYEASTAAKINQNQNPKIAVSHVNNYFETPKAEENNSATEYNYGYEY